MSERATTNDALKAELLRQLSSLLEGGQAHATFADAVKEMPFALQGERPAGVPYSAWQLLEHLRIAQRDILDFSDNADGAYQPMEWPKQYWPTDPAPPDEQAWQHTVAAIEQDRSAFEDLLRNGDLVAPFPWADDGQNLLREALLIADHSAYHVGELVLIRRLLGAWK